MPAATPYSAVYNKNLGNEKTWVLYSRLSHLRGSGKPLCKDKQPVSPRHEIIYEYNTPISHTSHVYAKVVS